jgi:hypothetical protein
MGVRIVAVDWSGAKSRSQQNLWVAELDSDDLSSVTIRPGGSREEVTDHLLRQAARTEGIVVGLDFAFSLPAWFLEHLGVDDARALWDRVADEGEQWLQECRPPFWGRSGTKRPDLIDHFRRTDREVPAVAGVRPKSVFQISGAGTVGTASLRGMPVLKKLRQGGYSVWPFDPVRLPLVVEIYPRLLTGVVNKGNLEERRKYLDSKYPDLSASVRELAAFSEDSFDALVSVLVMAAHADDLLKLDRVADDIERREGRIWFPPGTSPPPPLRRQRDSSRTRVGPVFDELLKQGDSQQWIARLLDLGALRTGARGPWYAKNLALLEKHWAPDERCLHPPVALLSWLIRNLNPPAGSVDGVDAVSEKRKKLVARDPETVNEALRLLRTAGMAKSWHVLEGPTCPDVLLLTQGAIIVIEGKRTEGSATVDTKFMSGRYQILRHLDAAWEIKGDREVFGLLIVEAEDDEGGVPSLWEDTRRDLTSTDVLRSSLPHRSREEQGQIAEAFVGVTTWQAVCREFRIPTSVLLETV